MSFSKPSLAGVVSHRSELNEADVYDTAIYGYRHRNKIAL